MECCSGQQNTVQQGMCSQWSNSVVEVVNSETASAESVVPSQC
jgi:hypothetical protein